MTFQVYKSSAGSGKTYTLVKEYLKLVLVNKDLYNRILAITFTNKAAGEMKERIIAALQDIANLNNNSHKNTKDLVNDLSVLCKLDVEIIKNNAAQVLETLLHHYSEFSVSTIDSFIHRIVKSFAYELKVPYNFSVEMDTEMLEEAINLLLNNAGKEKSLTTILIDLIKKQVDDNKKWEIDYLIFQSTNILLQDHVHQKIERLQHLELNKFIEYRKKIREIVK